MRKQLWPDPVDIFMETEKGYFYGEWQDNTADAFRAGKIDPFEFSSNIVPRVPGGQFIHRALCAWVGKFLDEPDVWASVMCHAHTPASSSTTRETTPHKPRVIETESVRQDFSPPSIVFTRDTDNFQPPVSGHHLFPDGRREK